MSTAKPTGESRASLLKSFLKGLALSFGAGLMFRAGQSRACTDRPILTRLNRAENLLTEIEQSRSPEAAGALRDCIQSLDQRCAEQIAGLGERLNRFEHHIPDLIAAAVNARVLEAETRLKAEMGEMQRHTLDTLLETLETRVAQGIAQVESSLVAQSRDIGELCQRMNQTDANLLRILSIVEGKNFAGLMEAAARA